MRRGTQANLAPAGTESAPVRQAALRMAADQMQKGVDK